MDNIPFRKKKRNSFLSGFLGEQNEALGVHFSKFRVSLKGAHRAPFVGLTMNDGSWSMDRVDNGRLKGPSRLFTAQIFFCGKEIDIAALRNSQI